MRGCTDDCEPNVPESNVVRLGPVPADTPCRNKNDSQCDYLARIQAVSKGCTHLAEWKSNMRIAADADFPPRKMGYIPQETTTPMTTRYTSDEARLLLSVRTASVT